MFTSLQSASCLTLFILYGVSTIQAQDSRLHRGRCRSKSDVIIMITCHHHNRSVEVYEEFSPLETFLLDLVNYFEFGESMYNIGLMMYNRLPVVTNDLRPFRDRKQINTRISLMGNTSPYKNELGGMANVSEAILTMDDMFSVMPRTSLSSNRLNPKIGIIFLNGSIGREQEVLESANESKKKGTIIYVIMSNLTGTDKATAMQIATDLCKVYEVDNFGNDLDRILTDLGNSVCAVSDRRLNQPQDARSCFYGTYYIPPPTNVNAVCQDIDTLFPDPFNCAFFFKCNETGHAVRMRCMYGEIFFASTQTCNHRDASSCYTQIYCPEPTGLFPYPGDCTKFLNCYKDLPYIQFCPAGLVFDTNHKRCLHSSETVCKQ